MEKFEFEGNEYIILNGKILDNMFCVVEDVLSEKIKTKLFLECDYKSYGERELLEFILKIKEIELFSFAKSVIEYAYTIFSTNANFVRYTLPIYTSCLRQLNLSKEAIDFAEKYIKEDTLSGHLYTSLAAAACDIEKFYKANEFISLAEKFKTTDPATNDLIINNVRERISNRNYNSNVI